MSNIEYVKEIITKKIEEEGFKNDQIEIDFADICEEEEVQQAAQELGYQAAPATGQGCWWIYK